MGYLTALQWLPSLLFALHAGAWVDRRGKRRKAMILADLGRAAALATIPLCYALHVLTLAQMYAVTFVAGALSVLFTVSDGTLFVSIVPPDSYVDGQSLIYGSRAFSFMGGPSVGGLLVAGAERRRSRSSRTRCPSSARRCSWPRSSRPSRPRPTAPTGSPPGSGSSPAPPSSGRR